MIDVNHEKLLSLAEVAERIGCSVQTVRKWAAVGCDGRVLETIKFGRLVRTSAEAVERFKRPHITRQHAHRDELTEYQRIESALVQRHR